MSARERFGRLVGAADPSLGEGCFLIAEHLGRPIGAAVGLPLLDDLADRTREAIEGPADLASISRALFGPLGFGGATSDYYDVRNSMLGDVIARRVGIPITLAVIVIEVSDRLGVVASGVGMPGHFLVGDGPRPTRWLDAFGGGRWLDEQAAKARFGQIHGPAATFDPAFLRPTPAPHVLGRVLANLAGIHRSNGDPTALLRTLELRGDIPGVGTVPRARVELAEAYVACGRFGDAIDLLDAVRERIDPRRRDGLTSRIEILRASLN